MSHSYYEIVLGVIIVIVAVAFLQDSNTVKAITSSLLFLVYLSKEILVYFDSKSKKEVQEKLEAIKDAETQKELDKLKSELTKINLKLFSR